MAIDLWDAVALLSERRVLSPSDGVSLQMLRRMASLGYCDQSGQLFHVLPLADRMTAALRPQGSLFA